MVHIWNWCGITYNGLCVGGYNNYYYKFGIGYFIYGLWDCVHSVPFYCFFFFVMGLLCTYFVQFHMFHIGSGMGMMWVSPIPVPYVDSHVSMRLLCTYYFHKGPHASRPSHISGEWYGTVTYQSNMIVDSSL